MNPEKLSIKQLRNIQVEAQAQVKEFKARLEYQEGILARNYIKGWIKGRQAIINHAQELIDKKLNAQKDEQKNEG